MLRHVVLEVLEQSNLLAQRLWEAVHGHQRDGTTQAIAINKLDVAEGKS